MTNTLLKVLAVVSGACSLFAVFSIFAQASLTGATPEAIWRSRVYIWWIDFLLGGLLLMLGVYLWRKSERLTNPIVQLKPRLRVALFLLGQLLLTGGLYCSDLAWYLRQPDIHDAATVTQAGYVSTVAWVLLGGAVAAFWYVWARTGNRTADP